VLQAPILIRDRAPFYRGFLLGSLVALLVYAGLFGKVWDRSQRSLAASVAAVGADETWTELAIARAEEINLAAAAYVESCGRELAEQAWREAGDPDQRYQLLTSFIPFSPDSLDEYMPDDFELVLWDQVESEPATNKVGLLAAGMVLEY
jgi:hypothetical protein